MKIMTLDLICMRFENRQIQVLVKERNVKGRPFKGLFAITGGFIHVKEAGYDTEDASIDSAFERIFKEKVHSDTSIINYVESMNAVGNANRDPDGWALTIPYICILDKEKSKLIDMSNSKWIDIKDVVDGKIELAFDHKDIICNAYQTIINKSQYTSILLAFMDKKFTIPEIRNIYSCLNMDVSKVSIGNRYVKTNIIQDTGDKASSTEKGGKRASLYQMEYRKELKYFGSCIG